MPYKDPILQKASNSFQGQMRRCYSKKCASYKYYGAKGIGVKYSWDEFKVWYVKERETFYGTRATVDRIDPEGHYELGNIRLISQSENTREMLVRCADIFKKSNSKELFWISDTGEKVFFSSAVEASKFFGVAVSTIRNNVNGFCVTSRFRNRIGYV